MTEQRTPDGIARRRATQRANRAAIRLPLTDCATCGTPHRTKDGYQACVRHKSPTRGGAGCKNNPVAGANTCRYHGGTSYPEVAKNRVAELKAIALAAKWGVPIETTPTEAILDQVKAAAGNVRFYKLQVDALTNAEFVWGKTRFKSGGDDRGTTYEATVNMWVRLYDAERTTLVKFASEAIRSGIEERKVRLAEQQGALVGDVIKAILAELKLTKEQQALVSTIVPRHLRLLTSA